MFALAILLVAAAQLLTAIVPKYQTCKPLWKKKGCEKGLHHNLTLLIDDRMKNVIDWNNFGAYETHLMCRCRQAALAGGYKWFAVDNEGICSAKHGELASYLKPSSFDVQAKCSGPMRKTLVLHSDFTFCYDGKYRPAFYEIIKRPPIGSAPVGSAPEEEEEEEIEETPKGSAPVGSAPEQEEEEEEKEEEEISSCSTTADIVIVIDVSGSIQLEGLNKIKTFLKDFFKRFDFTINGTRIGIVTYDQECRDILPWNDPRTNSMKELTEFCDQITFHGGSTLTGKGINCAKDIVQSWRRDAPITVVVITDGMTWGGVNEVQGPSNTLRELGCKVVSIGVGLEIDPEELLAIAGTNSTYFHKDGFSDLAAAKFLNQLIAKSCR